MNIPSDLPSDIRRRIEKHPAFPSRRNGRMKFYIHIFAHYIDSDEFKIKELEYRLRQVERERDQARRQLEQNVKSEDFLKRVQSGEFSRSFASERQKAGTARPATAPTESGPDSVH